MLRLIPAFLGALLAASSGVLISNPQTFRLVTVLRETIEQLAQPDTDYSFSDWSDGEEAQKEMDAHVTALQSGDLEGLARLRMLFAPTGQLQEISIASGWSEEFLELASRFDEAIKGLPS